MPRRRRARAHVDAPDFKDGKAALKATPVT
jgi:hypothetical protein